jgi:hypothetical protein
LLQQETTILPPAPEVIYGTQRKGTQRKIKIPLTMMVAYLPLRSFHRHQLVKRGSQQEMMASGVAGEKEPCSAAAAA